MAEKPDNRMSPCWLGDFDVEQCVEDMFVALTPAPAQGRVANRTLENESQGFMQMVTPRHSLAPLTPPLSYELREELLGLCAELVQASKARKLQTLLLCGIEPGVGTSFLAQHLSRMLAEFRQLRIALLTVMSVHTPSRTKLRASVVRRNFDYLLFRTERPNLMEIASAQGAVTLSELLSGATASVALRQVQQEFDFIVIDAPAVAVYAEVALLAAMLDGVILVAEQHVTSLRQMDKAYHRLHQAQANVLGIVLNRQTTPRP
jgi:Mrp family chromosome partitioning ATPase